MWKLLRSVVVLFWLPFIFAFSYQAWLFIKEANWSEAVFFLVGLAVYVLAYMAVLRPSIRFLETLEHELAHAVASMAVLRMPTKLLVNPGSKGKTAGMVDTPAGGCFLVSLAPYFLPLFTLPLLLAKPFVPPPFELAIDFLIGFTLAFHYVRVLKNLRIEQSDITKTGLFFSFAVLILLNVVFLVIIISIVTDNYSAILEYIEDAFERTKLAYRVAYETIVSLDLSALKRLRAIAE